MASPPAIAATAQTLVDDGQGHVRVDLPCLNCQYNLRTLNKTARCPECGALVESTIQAATDRVACRAWVNMLHRGVKCMFVAQLCFAASVLTMRFDIGLLIGVIAGLGMMTIAMPMLAIPAPRNIRYGWAPWHQGAVIALMLVTGISLFAVFFVVHRPSQLFLTLVAFGIGWFGSLTLLLLHGMLVARWLSLSTLKWNALALAVAMVLTGLTWLALGSGSIEFVARQLGLPFDWSIRQRLWYAWSAMVFAVYLGSVALTIAFMLAFYRERRTDRDLLASSTD